MRMRVAAPFERFGEHIVIELPGARALFTTRHGGDLARDAGVTPERLVRTRQVHGAVVRAFDAAFDPRAPLAEADGQATGAPCLALMVLVADCLPIALAGEGAVAVLHGGWRGLAQGIIAEGVGTLRTLGACGPLSAAIGPGIGRCCYEVGEQVHAAFAARGHERRDGARIDLKAIARAELLAAGVEVVHDVGLCTSCAPGAPFHSYRREAGETGRQAGVVWLR